MIVSVTALAGGGFVVERNAANLAGTLELYDSDGNLFRELGVARDPIAASDGSFVAGSLQAIQWYDQDGDAVGGPIAILPAVEDLPGNPGQIIGLVATGDGVLQATWGQYSGSPKTTPYIVPYFASVDRDGTPLVGPITVEGFDHRTIPPPPLYEMQGGRVASIHQNVSAIGSRYGVQFRDGEGNTLGPLIGIAQTENVQASLLDGETLADGSLALLFSASGTGKTPMVVLRVDEQGAAIGQPSEIFEPPYPRNAGEFFPNQDGGYTRLWQIWGVGLKYQVYDADGNALTDQLVAVPFSKGHESFTYAADMLADGRIAIVVEDTNDPDAPIISTHFIDYAPSHDAQWGGKQAYVETWQEQELLTREDGTEMLLSNAGILMKPWIANFQAASDDDGINATANEMANHLLGGNGANVFGGGGGNDKLYMLGGDDWGFGDGGNDLIDAGDGNDVLVGGLGDDSLAGGAGADTVAGDEGDDAVNGHEGDDIVHGAAGNDLVTGDDGADTLYGGNDDDWLNGSAGDDVVSGDRGADTLEGGADADQFRFGSGSGNDIIIDFEYGATGDRIVVDVAGNGSLNDIVIESAASLFDAAEDTEDGVSIGLGGGHSILLVGFEKADLGADIFLLV